MVTMRIMLGDVSDRLRHLFLFLFLLLQGFLVGYLLLRLGDWLGWGLGEAHMSCEQPREVFLLHVCSVFLLALDVDAR